MFHDRSLLERCIWGFVLPVLEHCSAVWCSAAYTHLKLLDRAVSGAQLLTEGVFERDIAHRISVAVLCMLYKIRCNPIHPLNDVLSGPYVPVRVTRGSLVAHRIFMRRLAAEPSSTAGLSLPFQCPSGTIFLTTYLMVWDWRVSRAGPMLLYWPNDSIPTIVFYYFTRFSCFCLYVGIVGLGYSDL